MYSDPNYYDTGGGAPWWIWPLAIIAIIIVISFLYKKIRNAFLHRKQLELVEDWTMLRVSVPKEPHASEDDQRKNFQEMLSVIEPFYASINSLFDKDLKKSITGQDHISMEIIAKNGKIFFYIGCPTTIAEIVEKNLHAQYPEANIDRDLDYSIFPDKPLPIEILTLILARRYIFPIRTYKNLEEDPLNAITNSLSKLSEDESAGIQVMIRPNNQVWRVGSEKAAYNIQQGKTRLSYSNNKTVRATETFFNFIGKVGNNAVKPGDKDGQHDPMYNPQNPYKQTPMQEAQVKLLGEKAAKIGFDVQVRIVAVAKTAEEAKLNAKNIASAFSQFNAPDSNNILPKKAKNKGREVGNYIFRIFGAGLKMILNTEELASIIHMPNRFVETPNVAWLLAKRQAPPSNLPDEGTIIGNSIYRGETKPVRIKEEDRLRHIYMIGKTGVGKTVLFENMIMQDIREGRGVAYLDPNGDAAEYILNRIPKERAEDVIYFNPADIERPMGLNMLEWKTPEQRDFLVQETIQMFYKLFDPGQTGIVGPQFEHWMRNAALTLMVQPEGGTIVDIPRLFTDPDFEKECVKNVTDPVVKAFWQKQMAKTSDFHKSEMLNYFTSKFGRFMTNDMMRNIIGQNKSAFDFREVMDGKKILICNLSKGLIGEINAFLLGMIIVSKIAMGAFSRQDTNEKDRTPFYLYVDEFQNFITDVFATILSESRKYKLSLNITNQYVAQLDEKIRDAVMGNAGTLVAFRIGAVDAEFLIKEFDPLKIDDMTTIDKYNFYIKMLIDGAPTRPFNAASVAPDQNENKKLGSAMVELSRLKYGKPREIVDQEIRDRSKVDVIDLPGIGEGNIKGVLG
ncbi:MAG: hypothetical protein WC080_03860 [Patescibacteria group bacterium]